MPDEEVADQTADLIPGAAEATLEAPAGVVEPVVESVAGEASPVPASPVFDLSSDEGIKAALEANPTLAGYIARQQADAANTARQRRDAELRREQGTIENAQAYHRALVDAIARGDDIEQVARQTPLFVTANQNATRIEFARNFLQGAADAGDETAKGLLETLTGDADETVKVAQIALNSMVTRARSDERSKLTFDDVMGIPALKDAVDTLVAQRVAAELAAQELEERTANITNPPQVSGMGPGAGGIDPDRQRLMTTGIPIADEAARKRIAAALGVPL